MIIVTGNTVPAIIGALGAPAPRQMCEAEYDTMFTMVLKAGAAPKVTKSTYGDPSGKCD